jgi:hypothetical protein
VKRVISAGGVKYDARPLPRKAIRPFPHATEGFRLSKRSADCPGYTVVIFDPPLTAGYPRAVHCTCPSHQYRSAGTFSPCKHVLALAHAHLIRLSSSVYCLPQLPEAHAKANV